MSLGFCAFCEIAQLRFQREISMLTIKANDNVFDKYADSVTLKRIVQYGSVSEMWGHCLSEYGLMSAVVDGEDLTYSALEKRIALLRGALLENGLKRGDFVGIYAPNSVSFVVSFLAITTCGMCAVLLPPHLNGEAVYGCVLKYGLKALVYDSSLRETVSSVKARCSDVCFFSVEECVSSAESGSSALRPVPAVDVLPSENCCVVFTGGTTGRSKGALLTNGALMTGVRYGCYGYSNVFFQRYLLILPLTHVFGLIRTLLTSLYTGSSLYICRNNKDMFRDIALHKPTVLVMVPALAELALSLSKQLGRNLLGGDLKTVIAGAAVVSPYLVTEYGKLGIDLFPGYGLTESANLVSGNPEMRREPTSVGFLYPGIEARVVDGELWLKGPNMFSGYVGEDEENSSAFEDGYFKTGDLVRFDNDGLLYITGRKKEVIVLSSGEKVSPEALETEFCKSDCIQDCLVCASPSAGEAERLILQVYPRKSYFKENGIGYSEAFVRKEVERINSALPSAQRVSEVAVRDNDFVRTPNMKIDRARN